MTARLQFTTVINYSLLVLLLTCCTHSLPTSKKPAGPKKSYASVIDMRNAIQGCSLFLNKEFWVAVCDKMPSDPTLLARSFEALGATQITIFIKE